MVFRWQIHYVRPKASVKLAADAKEVSYMNINMNSMPEHKTATLLNILTSFFYNQDTLIVNNMQMPLL